MIVKCQPLWDGDPRPTCGMTYNDEHRWTLCPHPYLDDPRALELIERQEAIIKEQEAKDAEE